MEIELFCTGRDYIKIFVFKKKKWPLPRHVLGYTKLEKHEMCFKTLLKKLTKLILFNKAF